MFFDLSIPYLEAGPKAEASKNKTLNLHRLKTLARAMELGYTAVAYDRPFKGVMSDADRCRIPRFSPPSLLEAAGPTLPSAVALHRDRNGVPRSAPFRQYTRVTVTVDRMSVMTAFNAKSLLRSYDLVAAEPLDQDAFDRACQVSDVDIIALDFPLKFRLKLPMVESAIKRGVHFEIKYSYLIADVHIRKQVLSDARLLVDWTRGKNLIISSSASNVNDIRGPYDVANLSSFLLGLSKERAKAAISGNCRALISNALRKKDYKEAIRVERISSDEQLDSESAWFGDWKEWDPISSGEGDLPRLDDISKLFTAVSKLPKSPIAIDFPSCTEQFSLKDHISTFGNKTLAAGEKATNRELGSGAVTKLSSLSNDIPVADMKSVVGLPTGLQLSSCHGGKFSQGDISTVSADSKKPTLPLCNNEILGSCIADDVPSPEIPLDCCRSAGKDNMITPDFNLASASSVDNESTMCMEDVKRSCRTNVVSVAMETPSVVTKILDGISCAGASHVSSNDNGTFSIRSLEDIVLEEHVKANSIATGESGEDLSDNTPLHMVSIEPVLRNERDGASVSPNDMTVEDGLTEVKMQETEVLIDSDCSMKEIFIDGCASYRFRTGKQRRKGRSQPAHPLPFKGLLKPMLFKRKSCQSRRRSKH